MRIDLLERAMHLSTRRTRTLHSLVSDLSCSSGAAQTGKLLVESIARLYRAEVVSLFSGRPQDISFDHQQSTGISPDLLSDYLARLQFLSPFRPALSRRAVGLSSSIMRTQTLMNTEFYDAFLRRAGIRYGLNIRIAKWHDSCAEIRIWRNARHGDFDASDVELAKLLKVMIPSLADARVVSSPIACDTGRDLAERGAPALTPREAAIVKHLLAGASDKEIARGLGIELCTVRTHLGRVFSKFAVRSRVQLMAKVRSM